MNNKERIANSKKRTIKNYFVFKRIHLKNVENFRRNILTGTFKSRTTT